MTRSRVPPTNRAPNENMEVEGFFRGIRTQ